MDKKKGFIGLVVIVLVAIALFFGLNMKKNLTITYTLEDNIRLLKVEGDVKVFDLDDNELDITINMKLLPGYRIEIGEGSA
ncbi:MAG: hypothetical protein HUJ56_01045 [Erysipelotrichaceae bacterium]|nr:hypothetical protein [Erysipelotrichaceae bacterium]